MPKKNEDVAAEAAPKRPAARSVRKTKSSPAAPTATSVPGASATQANPETPPAKRARKTPAAPKKPRAQRAEPETTETRAQLVQVEPPSAEAVVQDTRDTSSGEPNSSGASATPKKRRNGKSAVTLTLAPETPPDEGAEAQAQAPITLAEAPAAAVPLRAVTLSSTDAEPRSPAEAAEVSFETGVTVRPKPARGRRPKKSAAAPEVEPEAPTAPNEAVLGEPVEVTPRGRGRGSRKAKVQAPIPEPSIVFENAGVPEPTMIFGAPPVVGAPLPEADQPEVTLGDATFEAGPVSQPAGDESAGEIAPPLTSRAARQLLLDAFLREGRPMHVRDVERQFGRGEQGRLERAGGVESLLEALVTGGELIRTRKRTYGLPEAMNLVRARFQASASGFGFAIPEADGDDYYVAQGATLEAWNGDTVLVRPEGQARRGESPRATVVRILARAQQQLVGSLEFSKGYAILKADDSRARHRVLLLPEGTENVPAGARVVAQLFWPESTGEDEVFGRITRVLGETDDPETETQAVIVKYGLQAEFSPEALREAGAIPAQLPEAALSGRLDLRDYHIFTVDGRDAKDFDDAIHIQSAPEGNFVVGVHIADVSHYVTAGSALDQEAYARATSVYLPGHVLPMLPEHLSNGVCSLVPGEDRLTLSALMEVTAEGDVVSVQLVPSVIRSQARLTYDEVQAYSEATATLPEHARKVEGDLHLLLKLTSRMRQKRLREGSLDFKLREVKVDVDKEGNLQLIPIREETARGMIEDLMLLANKTVARFMLEKNAPALYRVHEEPTLGRFGEVSAALARMGIVLGEEPTPQAYQEALKRVRGTPQETAVNTLLLRSLKQARYSEENLGHFGLAFEEYLHFTSPIRRYPDLIVHRALRAVLAGEGQSSAMQTLRAELPTMGDHTSERERAAAEAERDLTKYYQAKWAQAHLGESFSGFVSGVTSFGLFVSLDNGVEGLLHISNLDDDYYVFLEDALILRGRSGGRSYRMGDSVNITIAQVNPLARQIDFSQETDMTDNNSRPRARRRGEREQERPAEAPRARTGEPRTQETRASETRTSDTRTADSGRPANGEAARGRGGRPSSGERLAPPRSAERGGGQKRRVITLDRPRNEHNRPVAVTVQRMYFGDWSADNLPEDEGSAAPSAGPNGNRRGGRPQGARPQAQAAPAGEGANRNRSRNRRRRGRSNGKAGDNG